MTLRRFGPHWQREDPDEPEVRFMATPLNQPCLYCREFIELGDSGQEVGVSQGIADDLGLTGYVAVVHVECVALHTIGHVWGVCSCHGFPDNRESALECWRRMMKHRGVPPEENEKPGGPPVPGNQSDTPTGP